MILSLYILPREEGSKQREIIIIAYPVFDPETFQMLFRGVTGVHIELVGKVPPRVPQTIRLNWVG